MRRLISQRMQKILLSLAILVFFLVCAIQILCNREDWPFSTFAMYKGSISPRNVFRVDVDFVRQDNAVISAYSLGSDGYFLIEKAHQTFTKYYLRKAMNVGGEPVEFRPEPGLIEAARAFVQIDIKNVLVKRKIFPQEVRIRYRSWDHFEPSKIPRPDFDKIVFRFLDSDLGLKND